MNLLTFDEEKPENLLPKIPNDVIKSLKKSKGVEIISFDQDKYFLSISLSWEEPLELIKPEKEFDLFFVYSPSISSHWKLELRDLIFSFSSISEKITRPFSVPIKKVQGALGFSYVVRFQLIHNALQLLQRIHTEKGLEFSNAMFGEFFGEVILVWRNLVVQFKLLR